MHATGLSLTLVHGYYHISPEIVKEIVEEEIPSLRLQIASYLSAF